VDEVMKKVESPSVAGQKHKPISVRKHAPRVSAPPKEHREAADLQRLIEKAKRLPAVRKELIRRIQDEIAMGTYETPEKLDIAIAAMLRDIADA
jgi:negative regulator of flagellin synthesis FlgM